MPITNYIIERQDLSVKGKWFSCANQLIIIHNPHVCRTSGGWNPVGELPSDQPLSYKCEGLINKKEYKFRVVAVNKMGNSEPGLFPKVVLAKDPWGKIRTRNFENAFNKIGVTVLVLFTNVLLITRWTWKTR